MALPKRKTSKAKKRRRRSHQALVPQMGVRCPFCKAKKLPHRLCSECGKR